MKTGRSDHVDCASAPGETECANACCVDPMSCVRVGRCRPLAVESLPRDNWPDRARGELACFLSDPRGRLAAFAVVLLCSWAAGILLGEFGFWLARK